MARVAPSERLRRELDELLAGVEGEADPIERIGRLGARLILQQALEDEVSEFLGRVRYERAEEPVSHRNGYEPRRVVTTAGPVELERPRVRKARELGFESRILGRHVARTYALESLIICSFLRGLSVRDVEAALEETFEEPVIGKSTVARVCLDTRERYRRWCERRLDEHDLVYLFCDALHLKLRPDDEPAEGALVAWGVTLEGRDTIVGRTRDRRRYGTSHGVGPPGYQRGLRNYDSGLRNGFRARKVQTLEGELRVEIPQVREAAEPFVSKLFPCSTKVLRTEPLRAMVIGAFVTGLSMRDIESLCEKAGLGKLSKTTASRICTELRERFEPFKRRDLYDVQLAALFLDAVFLSVRPNGPQEGVLVAWASASRASGCCSQSCSGCASRTRTGSRSAAT